MQKIKALFPLNIAPFFVFLHYIGRDFIVQYYLNKHLIYIKNVFSTKIVKFCEFFVIFNCSIFRAVLKSEYYTMKYYPPPYKSDVPSYSNLPLEPEKSPIRLPNPVINVVLFVLTVGSTLLAGAFLENGNPFIRTTDLYKGIPFALTLLTIIGFHEFGHYFMCRRHGIAATLPYFIPAPPPFFIIGTLGAVIKIRAPITNNRALFDIGAAGPIAGLIVALPAIGIGLYMSEIRQVILGSAWSLGDPIIMKLISRLILGEIPEGFDVYINSIAFAGWVGLIVTAFNLLPIGQLDGGHIAYALLGKWQALLGYTVFFILFPLALFWSGWFVFIIIALITRIKHPTGITALEPLDFRRKVIGVVCLLMFVVCFIPIPFKGMGIINMLSILF